MCKENEGNKIVKTNSDFLFIYEGTRTNPNGDPDMENKPRMDYDTKTNLVTDLRIKRNIREYLKDSGDEIFVDTLEENKVTVEVKLNSIIKNVLDNEAEFEKIIKGNEKISKKWKEFIQNLKKDMNKDKDNEKEKKPERTFEEKYPTNKEIYDLIKTKAKDKNFKSIQEKEFNSFNNHLLETIIKNNLIDIRMFGGAFAVEGFSRTYTGAIQLNWGYSLHPVELIKSDTIVTIMNEDASTFGKDYRLYYSLIAFHGTINKHLADKNGLTNDDVKKFRDSIISSVFYKPTRSKSDQYPIFYLEIEYNENYNCYLRDLRDFIKCEKKDSSKTIRSLNDLEIDLSDLSQLIKNNQPKIKQIHIWKTPLSETDFDVFEKSINDGVKKKFEICSIKIKE
ncbi:MAG: type I CRISPR-associated protein Cas7 [Bacteroidales bacterium]|nr:type I CRISPR-associated protein Cas7 [Bacteroidales bacterium]